MALDAIKSLDIWRGIADCLVWVGVFKCVGWPLMAMVTGELSGVAAFLGGAVAVAALLFGGMYFEEPSAYGAND